MKDRKNLDQLATTMFGKNADVVKQVPGVAIFLADTGFIILDSLLNRTFCFS